MGNTCSTDGGCGSSCCATCGKDSCCCNAPICKPEEKKKEPVDKNKFLSKNYAVLPITGKISGLCEEGECVLLGLDSEFKTELVSTNLENFSDSPYVAQKMAVQLFFPQLAFSVEAEIYFNKCFEKPEIKILHHPE